MVIGWFAHRMATVHWTVAKFAQRRISLADNIYSCRLLCYPFEIGKEGREEWMRIALDVKVYIITTFFSRSAQATAESTLLKIFLKLSFRTLPLAWTWIHVVHAHTVKTGR